MTKTIKEMKSKALSLQGDYLRAYEDMMEAFEEFLKERHAAEDSIPDWVDGEDPEHLKALHLFLGLDSE